MSFSIISKNDSNITGTAKNNVKITGDNNDLNVKTSKDLWVSGNENQGDVTLRGNGRLAVTGEDNKLDVDASTATKGDVFLKGSYNTIGKYTGGSGNNTVSLRGTHNTLEDAVFKGGADRLTSINGTIGKANMGAGADFVGIKDAQDKFNIQGGAGTDTLWLDGITDLNNGSTASEFEKLYLKEFGSSYKVEKAADGKYSIKNGDNVLNIGSNGDALIWNGTEYKKASELAGATTGGGTTTAGEINQADINAGDVNNLDAKGKKLNTINLGLQDDKLILDKNSEGTASGGAGNDTADFADGLAKYDIVQNADGSYKLTHKDTSKALNLSDFETYNFGGIQSIAAADLKNWVAPVYGDGADVASLDKAANDVTANQNLKDGADVINYKAGATGYTLNGGAGADLFNAFDYNNYADDAALKTALANSSASQIQFGGSKINNDVENFKFNVGGAEKAFTWGQLLAFLGL